MGIAVVLTTLSLGSILLSVVFLPFVVVRLPEDYFARSPGESLWSDWSLPRSGTRYRSNERCNHFAHRSSAWL